MGSLIGEGHAQTKLHAVCVPYPAQGHITPMLQLAKLLHAQGFHITFVHTEYNYRRSLRSRGPNSGDGIEHFKFEAIPDGLPPSDADVTQDIPTLCSTIMVNFLEPFKQLLRKLNDSSSGSPPVTVIVSDSVMPFTLDAARDLGNIPLVWLWTASACGFLAYYQFQELLNKGIVPFQDSTYLTDGSLDKVLDWVPSSLKDIQMKYMPSFMRITDINDVMFNYLKLGAERSATSSAPVLINTFDTFEHDVLHDISKLVLGPLYTVGPLQLLIDNILPQDAPENALGANLWKEDSDIFKWLDSKNPRSVVYVSFGSITTMTNENLVEFAWGLANSKHPFIWVLRPGLVTGDKPVIPPEFINETKERGLITRWVNQKAVLEHPSVGVFLTHCGWNSTLDTVGGGVPVLCWPFFAEQQTNGWFNCNKWGIGMEIDSDVKREEVEKQVRELTEGENGTEMATKAREWKKLAREAVEAPSGSSYLNFSNLVKDVFLPLKY